MGDFVYTIEAWRDLFGSWRGDIGKNIAAGQDVSLELGEGRDLIEQAAAAASGRDAEALRQVLANLARTDSDTTRRQILLDDSLGALEIKLSAADLKAIEDAVPASEFAGTRYAEPQMKQLDAEQAQ